MSFSKRVISVITAKIAAEIAAESQNNTRNQCKSLSFCSFIGVHRLIGLLQQLFNISVALRIVSVHAIGKLHHIRKSKIDAALMQGLFKACLCKEFNFREIIPVLFFAFQQNIVNVNFAGMRLSEK